jgi:hypothetical protein
MKNIKLIVALFALAATTGLSINSNTTTAKARFGQKWLKYDCARPGQVEQSTPNTFNNVSGICPDQTTILCAELYNDTDLELDPAFPASAQIYRVKIVQGQPVPDPIDFAFCPIQK